MDSPAYPTPLVNIPMTGDNVKFDDLIITFKVDEELRNYEEIFTWIQGLTFPESTDQFKKLEEQRALNGEGLKSDGFLMILNSSKNPILTCNYQDLFPTALSSINVVTTDTSVSYLTATVMFKYTLYTMDRT